MVYTVRYRCGQQLAIEAPVDADLVSTVPESATPAALGYAGKVYFLLINRQWIVLLAVELEIIVYKEKHISVL